MGMLDANIRNTVDSAIYLQGEKRINPGVLWKFASALYRAKQHLEL